jgi:hypothetical protein
VNVGLLWDEEKPCVSECDGIHFENVEWPDVVEGAAEPLPSLVIRESCSCRKLGSGVPRTVVLEDALTTSFKEVVMMAWDNGEASMTINGSFPNEVCQDMRCPNHMCHSLPETRKLYSRTPIAVTSRLRKTVLGMPVISCLKGRFVQCQIGRKESRTKF